MLHYAEYSCYVAAVVRWFVGQLHYTQDVLRAVLPQSEGRSHCEQAVSVLFCHWSSEAVVPFQVWTMT